MWRVVYWECRGREGVRSVEEGSVEGGGRECGGCVVGGWEEEV